MRMKWICGVLAVILVALLVVAVRLEPQSGPAPEGTASPSTQKESTQNRGNRQKYPYLKPERRADQGGHHGGKGAYGKPEGDQGNGRTLNDEAYHEQTQPCVCCYVHVSSSFHRRNPGGFLHKYYIKLFF